jgi:transcriptional regulator with XRE-family HTH domain
VKRPAKTWIRTWGQSLEGFQAADLSLSKASINYRYNNKQYQEQNKHILCTILLVMGKTTPPLLPRVARLLEGVGTHLKLARLRRKYSAETVAQRVGITRRTLSKVEQGDPAVALGVYARVMQVLRLEDDLALLAKDDELGRKLQDAGITAKLRAPKRHAAAKNEIALDQAEGRG